MHYLNITEVESALTVATSAPFAGFTQLIPLPNLTWEGRQCNAIRIRDGSDPGRPGVLFLAGIHAREWGSPDILIFFIQQLEQAYQGGIGITLGGNTFSASDIKTISQRRRCRPFAHGRSSWLAFKSTPVDVAFRDRHLQFIELLSVVLGNSFDEV